MVEGVKCCVGLDLSDACAMVSFMRDDMKRPETISTITGSEVYQIPLVVGQKKGMGQWTYGEEAKRMLQMDSGYCADRLLSRSVAREKIYLNKETYEGKELLALFLKKVLALPGRLSAAMEIDRIVVTVENLNKQLAQILLEALEKIGIPQKKCHVQDYRESFYFYALNQKKELWIHDVALFRLTGDRMKFWCLQRNMKTSPQLISVQEKELGILGPDRDQSFLKMVKENFDKKLISTSYLIGEGFEGNWMKQSLMFLCNCRKVFLGKNLYTVGACYTAYIREKELNWPFVYMGDNEMKINVSLLVRNLQKEEFYSLITAGDNWYEAKGECEIILEGEQEVDFYLQMPQSREAVIKTLELTDLPKRPDRTTKLRIKAEPISDSEVSILIRDLGFGELFRSSDKTWKYTLAL